MPQPIDLQTELGRLITAERVQQVADRASLAAQQRVAADVQQQRIATETQVQQLHPKSENVETETRRRNPYMGRRKRPPAQETPPEEKPGPPVELEQHQLDVTI
jgi:hypothetical protein